MRESGDDRRADARPSLPPGSVRIIPEVDDSEGARPLAVGGSSSITGVEVASPRRSTGPGVAEPRRVAVLSDLRLLEETVAAALAGAGHQVLHLSWPDRDEHAAGPDVAPVPPPEVLVIVCEAAGAASVEAVRRVVAQYDSRCLVVAGVRSGPLWGGYFDAGASAVVPAAISVDELLEAVETLARGDEVTGIFERQVLLRRWFAAQAEREVDRARIARLTPREHEVLVLLHRGFTTAMIAERLDVSPTTVRSQIRAILRKLGVQSQLAAVAVLASTLGSSAEHP